MASTVLRSVWKASTKYATASFQRSRQIQKTVHRNLSNSQPNPKAAVTLHFYNRCGTKITTKASVGDNLLDVIIDNDIDVEGYGACEGTLACSTCHLIFEPKDFDSIPEKAMDEELDMLDLAFGLTPTSRLGCQVYVRKEMDGWKIKVPEAVSDARDV